MSNNFVGISDLQQAEDVGLNDVFEVGVELENGRFASKKISYGFLVESIQEATTDRVVDQLGIKDTTNIQSTVDYVDSLSAQVEILDDVVRFNTAPTVVNDSTGPDSLQTRRQVENLVVDASPYIGPHSHIHADPQNSRGSTKEYQYIWKIENGRYDSSESYDSDGFPMEYVQINQDTGYLTVYGWLASYKDVKPQNAWVGLYGKMVIGDKDSPNQDWVLLQVQPWIVGEHSNRMQYVGFNVPVRKNMKLKIMTGFPVNGTTSGFQTPDGHSLLMTRYGNVPNTFVGYVIER